MEKIYDFIILGAGASGLCVALELAKNNKSILLIDKEIKNKNDRTWSFWEKGEGRFDHIVHHSWNHINFYGNQKRERLSISPYKYKMIRSADFYRDMQKQLSAFKQVVFWQGEVENVEESEKKVIVQCVDNQFFAQYVLDSISIPKIDPKKHMCVLQHFGGWFIKTKNPFFDPDNATFMDFRIPQFNDTRFFYVLPTSETEALVEIAIFSNEIQEKSTYDKFIEDYLKNYLEIHEFEIKEKEYGVIPMASYPFSSHSTKRHIRIGTAGGWVKSSSGYAFKRISERAVLLANQLLDAKLPDVDSHFLYQWMDKTLLKAMLYGLVGGKEIFEELFLNLSPQEVFRFLDEENNIFQDLKIMRSAPIWPFTKAAFMRPL